MENLVETAEQFSLKTKAISINNLCFSFEQERAILTDINLNISSGESVGLIGANGAGKTSLFLTICGILKPTYGEVKLFDRSIQTGEFNPEIGLVFQNPDDQLFCPTVRDDIAFGLENIELSPEEIEARISAALSLTGVTHLANRISHRLSGGEKCMVAIAAVLAMLPQIVLYDEPSANLDLRARRRLIKFLNSSHETTVISSHDLELIIEVCDRVVMLNQGRIVADGTPQEIMSNPSLMEANGLEVPHSLTQGHYHQGSSGSED
ncbi:MAG TPA: energy-coupling factor ABC transporter ATP-binding protein [Coleofasciculaceae cyanobacterium]|jgi:cobalt/nickel transport system ATP-binding protein